MVQSGDRLFYVNKTGQITQVTANEGEDKGVVKVSAPNGVGLQVSTFDLFLTETAAGIAAVRRLPASAKGGSVNIVR